MTDTPADDLVERWHKAAGAMTSSAYEYTIRMRNVGNALAHEIARLRQKLACGHPASLLIRSTESDYTFCELCEVRSERNDALTMEETLGARVRALTTALTLAQSQRDALAVVAELAARVFRSYEELHRAKGTADGDGKADANARMAQRLEDALASARGQEKP